MTYGPHRTAETGIVLPALVGIGALHGRQNPVRVIRLLDQSIGLDAGFAIAG